MIQTEYGVSRPWYWPFIAPFERFRNRREVIAPSTTTDLAALEAARQSQEVPKTQRILSNETTTSTYGDDDVSLERERVTSGSADESSLVISMARKRFDKKLAVRDVSVSVDGGEILALLGPNGAGKTTLVNCVLGLYRLTSGTAKVKGYDITTRQDQVYHHVGVCPQHEILWPDLTCEEHLLFYARLKGVEHRDEKEVVTQCLEEVELMRERRKLSKELSGGQKRRLSIAIALVARPAVVFLDEPTTGLDPNVKRSLWRVIKRFKELHKMCIILTTHSMYNSPFTQLKVGPKPTSWRIGLRLWFRVRCCVLGLEHISNERMGRDINSH